jgi:hypothetical protein
VCAAYPSIAAVEGLDLPVVERYRVNGGATIGLLFEAGTDRFVGGYFRRYLEEDQAWSPLFTPTRSSRPWPPIPTAPIRFHQVGGPPFRHFVARRIPEQPPARTVSPFSYSAVRLPVGVIPTGA